MHTGSSVVDDLADSIEDSSPACKSIVCNAKAPGSPVPSKMDGSKGHAPKRCDLNTASGSWRPFLTRTAVRGRHVLPVFMSSMWDLDLISSLSYFSDSRFQVSAARCLESNCPVCAMLVMIGLQNSSVFSTVARRGQNPGSAPCSFSLW